MNLRDKDPKRPIDPSDPEDVFQLSILAALFIIFILTFAFPPSAKAGIVEDVLKFNERKEGKEKAKVCAVLRLRLQNVLLDKQKVVGDLKGDDLKSAHGTDDLEASYKYIALLKSQAILEEQINLNHCGDVK
jgi:hypothetical protein